MYKKSSTPKVDHLSQTQLLPRFLVSNTYNNVTEPLPVTPGDPAASQPALEGTRARKAHSDFL